MSLGFRESPQQATSIQAPSKGAARSVVLPASPVSFQFQEITLLLHALEDRLSRLTHKDQILEEVKALRESIEDLAREDATSVPPSGSETKTKEGGKRL